MNHSLFKIGSAMMALAVVLGALGAHSLEKSLTTDMLNSFETGVRYHIYHGLALLLISAVADKLQQKKRKLAIILMLIGVICFSGSIYLFTFASIAGANPAQLLWWLTPLGGLLLIASWVLLISAAMNRSKNSQE